MQLYTTVLLFLCIFCWHFFDRGAEAMPSNQMTRIQEVFRTLMGQKSSVKKSAFVPDEAFWVLTAPEDDDQQNW
ncbi:hypothetical protein AAVH_24614 [Aphelenchoides avenae]|nr:hypothetical protein AAVH_24614 [Aphelenchus avenae]